MQGDNKRKNIMTNNAPECPICLGPLQSHGYCPTCDMEIDLEVGHFATEEEREKYEEEMEAANDPDNWVLTVKEDEESKEEDDDD